MAQRGDAVETAARRLDDLRAVIGAEAVFVAHEELLDDADAQGAGADLAAEIDVAVEVAGVAVVARETAVVVVPGLGEFADFFPAVRGGERRCGTRAGVGLEDGALGVHLLDGDAAQGLRLAPFHEVNAGVGLADGRGALRVPDAVGIKPAGADADFFGDGHAGEPAREELHAFDRTEPEIVFRGAFFVGRRRVEIDGGRGFSGVIEIGDEVVGTALERDAEGAGPGVFGRGPDGPDVGVGGAEGEPLLGIVGVGRIGRAGFQEAEFHEPRLVLRIGEHDAAERDGLMKGEDDVLLAGRAAGGFDEGEAVAGRVAGRVVAEAEEAEEIIARVGDDFVGEAFLAFGERAGDAILDVHVGGRGGVDEPVLGRADGQVHFAIAGGEALEAAVARVRGREQRDSADGFGGDVDAPDALGAGVEVAAAGEVVGGRGAEDGLAVAREPPRAGEGLEGMVAPEFFSNGVGLDQRHAALGDGRAEKNFVAGDARGARGRVIGEPAVRAVRAGEPRGAVREVIADIRVGGHFVAEFEGRMRDGFPAIRAGGNVAALLVFEIPGFSESAGGALDIRDEIADAMAVGGVHDEGDFAGRGEGVVDGSRGRECGFWDDGKPAGHGVAPEVDEGVEAIERGELGIAAGLGDFDFEAAGGERGKGDPAAGRGVLRGGGQGLPFFARAGGGIDRVGALEGEEFDALESLVVVGEEADEARGFPGGFGAGWMRSSFRPGEDEPRGLEVGDRRAGVDALLIFAGIAPAVAAVVPGHE